MMIMLVVVVVGTIAFLAGTLSSAQVSLDRNQTSANALAKAKEALIGRAATDITLPGSLPCPDTNDNGSADLLSGNDCANYIGRLPWKTLGLPDLRDGNGERLWYALSRNFRDDNSAHPLNSDAQGNLNIAGISPANNVIAIVFAPGAAINGQSRSATQTAACTSLKNTPTVAQSLCAGNYLEAGNANPSTAATPNTAYQQNALSDTFNDQLIAITHDQLFTPVEMRIAREVKNCLDDYAAANTAHYVWAATVSDTTPYPNRTSATNTLFGRLADTLGNSGDPLVSGLLNAIAALQAALNAYAANPSGANATTLKNAGVALASAATSAQIGQPTTPALSGAITNAADNAGDRGRDLANGVAGVTVPTVQSQIDQTNSLLAAAGLSNMGWNNVSSCNALFNVSGYWGDWRDQVFYQVAQGFAPAAAASCGASCLSISGSGNPAAGSGNYRAAVILARQKIGSQTRAITTTDGQFLEADASGDNRHATTPSRAFISYSPSDTARFPVVNDLVLCLDGKVNCK